MKKILFITFFALIMHSTFAEISLPKLTTEIEKAGCFVITESADNGNSDKYPVRIFSETNEEFMTYKRTSLHSPVFSDVSKVTLEDIKSELKKGTDIYDIQYCGKSYFQWKQGKHAGFSIQYWQSTASRPVDSAGHYIFWIFDTDNVYTVVLWDIPRPYIRNKDFDAMNEYFSFQEGQMADARRGLEQVQGYICTKESLERFYKALQSEAPTLPESVLRFQRTAKLLEEIIAEL